MGAAPPKADLVIACPAECSLHPDKIGQAQAEALMSIRASGAGIRKFMTQGATIVGRELAFATVQRHVKHYRLAVPEDEIVDAPPDKKVGDLEILDAIIAAGARNSRSWKPTIKDTLDAMKLKMQITGNSAFEDMLAAMEAGLDLADGIEEAPENPAALGTPDEIDVDVPEE